MRRVGPSTQQLPSQRHSAQPPSMTPTQSSNTTLAPSQTNAVEEPAEPPPIQLSPEQELVLSKVMRGENVFFTGPAGECNTEVFVPDHAKKSGCTRHREVGLDQGDYSMGRPCPSCHFRDGFDRDGRGKHQWNDSPFLVRMWPLQEACVHLRCADPQRRKLC